MKNEHVFRTHCLDNFHGKAFCSSEIVFNCDDYSSAEESESDNYFLFLLALHQKHIQAHLSIC